MRTVKENAVVAVEVAAVERYMPSFAGLFVGHDPSRGYKISNSHGSGWVGSGQDVFELSRFRGGSDRVGSGLVRSGGLRLSRVLSGHPSPTRLCLTSDVRPDPREQN